MAAMAADDYLRTTNSQATPPQACFLMGKCKVAPIKQISGRKMVLEAAVIGVRLLQLIQREMTVTFEQIFLCPDSQVAMASHCNHPSILHPSYGITSQLISIPPTTEIAVLRQTNFNRNV